MHLLPWSPLNIGEQAGLDAYRSMYDLPGFGNITKNDEFTLQFLREPDAGPNGSPLTPEDAFTQQMSGGYSGYNDPGPALGRQSGQLGIPLHAIFSEANLSQSKNALNALLPPPGSPAASAWRSLHILCLKSAVDLAWVHLRHLQKGSLSCTFLAYYVTSSPTLQTA